MLLVVSRMRTAATFWGARCMWVRESYPTSAIESGASVHRAHQIFMFRDMFACIVQESDLHRLQMYMDTRVSE